MDILPRIESGTEWDMAALCDADARCIGFVMSGENSGGYLKQVLLDQSQWTDQSGGSAKCKGLFIKGQLEGMCLAAHTPQLKLRRTKVTESNDTPASQSLFDHADWTRLRGGLLETEGRVERLHEG